jgi:hypothetical protein
MKAIGLTSSLTLIIFSGYTTTTSLPDWGSSSAYLPSHSYLVLLLTLASYNSEQVLIKVTDGEPPDKPARSSRYAGHEA